jgi:hypothetical protein
MEVFLHPEFGFGVSQIFLSALQASLEVSRSEDEAF